MLRRCCSSFIPCSRIDNVAGLGLRRGLALQLLAMSLGGGLPECRQSIGVGVVPSVLTGAPGDGFTDSLPVSSLGAPAPLMPPRVDLIASSSATGRVAASTS